MRPGTMDRLGFGPAQVCAAHPRIVYVSISGYGSGTPSAARPGYDIAAEAESGLMHVTGEPDGPPTMVGSAVVDVAASHIAAQAVVAALFRRHRTGRGDQLEVPLLDVGIHLQAQLWSGFLVNGTNPMRRGSGQLNVAPASDLIATADGHIMLSAYAPAHWARLCELIDPELATDPRFGTNPDRVAHRPELKARLSAALSHLTRQECVDLLAPNGIVVGMVRDYAEAAASADVVGRGLLQPVADGSYTTLGLPFTAAETARDVPRPYPQLGQHTAEVLAELGYDGSQVDALATAGVVALGLAALSGRGPVPTRMLAARRRGTAHA